MLFADTPTRLEHDLLGDREVPAAAYCGVHTLRAVENFRDLPARRSPPARDLVNALAVVKQAAALANRDLGLLDSGRAAAIVAACEEIRAGAPARPVRRRPDPGRRRHLDQHERQRGHRQPRPGDPRPRARRLRPPAPERARQPGRSRTNDVYPTALKLAAWTGILRLTGAMAVLRGGLRREGRGVRRRAQDGPHPAAGRGADDARAGVRHLRRHARRGRGAAGRGGRADPRDQPGGDGDRHRHHRPPGLCRTGLRASAARSPASRSSPRPTSSRPPRTAAPSCSFPAC